MRGTRLDHLIKTGVWGKRTKLLDAELERLDDPKGSRVLVGAYFLPRDTPIEKLPVRFHPARDQNALCCGEDAKTGD